MLVIIKENMVCALRGSVSSKGFPSGATLDVLHQNSGTASFRGSAKTDIGVVWANERGLWVFAGGEVVNLCDGVIDEQWSEWITDFSDVVVSGVNDRIIVQSPAENLVFQPQRRAWVFDTTRKHFVAQTCNVHTNVVQTNVGDFGNAELAVDSETGNIVDWSSDFTEENDEDSENSDFPRLEIRTQPMPADSQPFLEARPNNVLVGGDFDTTMTVAIAYGRSKYDEDLATDPQSGDDSIQPLEYGIRINGEDDTQRIPIGGVASRPAHRIIMTQENAADRMRIYGLGVEYSEDYTVDDDS